MARRGQELGAAHAGGIRRRLQACLGYSLAVIVAILFLLPLFWMVSSSLKPNYQVLQFPPRWFPEPIQWSNYPEALT
ncbi:MAG: carbohydrate ABC transporter permease, partial [Anaerolineae bacterium]|nr:carbohydrate ABC transporter permease [Anaerolineae bacterium]